jgi:hypothetical protein
LPVACRPIRSATATETSGDASPSHVGVHDHVAVAEDVVEPALGVADHPLRRPAGAGPLQQGDLVGDLVADER